MATVTINNSPVHSPLIITYPFGIKDSSYSQGYHTGLDFAPYGNTPRNPIIYPSFKGKVVKVITSTNTALGCQVQIQDIFGRFWRYCHLEKDSIMVKPEDIVNVNTPLAKMGTTGNSTGIHLHLELTATISWSEFLNPATALNIPNIDNTIILYDGNYEPIKSIKRKPFKWVLYARKLRERTMNK